MLAQSEPGANTAVSSSPSRVPEIGPKGRLDYPELDATRFCAFLAVFFFHGTRSLRKPGNSLSDLCSAASFGLPLFFLLSSYLITQVLLLERSLTGRVALKAFYVRRVLRIWPLYLSFLTANFIAGYFFHRLHIEPARFAAYLCWQVTGTLGRSALVTTLFTRCGASRWRSSFTLCGLPWPGKRSAFWGTAASL